MRGFSVWLSTTVIESDIVTAYNGVATIALFKKDIRPGLHVVVDDKHGHIRDSAIDPSLLEGKSEASFLVTLPEKATFVNIGGFWEAANDRKPADEWRVDTEGIGKAVVLDPNQEVFLYATWGSGTAGHTGLHGMAKAWLNVTPQGQEMYSGDMTITEGGAVYQGGISFTVVSDKEFLLTYKETVLDGNAYNGQAVNDAKFIKVSNFSQ